MMKLYYGRGTCALAAHIALYEAGLEFEHESVDLKTKKTQAGADYLQISPNGYVPALITDEGHTLTEAVAVLLYIADLRPDTKLAPAHPTFERYRVLEWLSFVSSELHRSYSPFFAPTTPEDYKPILRSKLQQRLGYTDGALSRSQYLLGSEFSVADAYLFAVLRWSEVAQIDLSAFAQLKRFQQDAYQRAGVQSALSAEGLKK